MFYKPNKFMVVKKYNNMEQTQERDNYVRNSKRFVSSLESVKLMKETAIEYILQTYDSDNTEELFLLIDRIQNQHKNEISRSNTQSDSPLLSQDYDKVSTHENFNHSETLENSINISVNQQNSQIPSERSLNQPGAQKQSSLVNLS